MGDDALVHLRWLGLVRRAGWGLLGLAVLLFVLWFVLGAAGTRRRPAACGRASWAPRDGGGWGPRPWRGDAPPLGAGVLALPHGRVMVPGPRGAAKSVLVMLLTLPLIRRKDPTLPLPILLSIN